MDNQPIVHALITSFLALGAAAGEDTLQRAGRILRDALKEPKLNPAAAAILEGIVVGVEHVDSDAEYVAPNVGWNHAAA